MVATIVGNTFVASIFGVAAFAQTAMGRLFLAAQVDGAQFYNEIYNGTLFATAAIALLLFMTGGVLIGNSIAACGFFPRWTGWVYAASVIGFVLSTFVLDIGQTISSALLIAATVVIAWRGPSNSTQER